MADANQTWRINCEGCQRMVEQGAPGQFASAVLDNGEVCQATVCAVCHKRISDYNDKREIQLRQEAVNKPAKVIRERPADAPPPVNAGDAKPAPTLVILKPLDSQGVPQMPQLVEPPVNPDSLGLILAEIMRGQDRMTAALERLAPPPAEPVEYERPRPVQQNMPADFGQQRKRSRGRKRRR